MITFEPIYEKAKKHTLVSKDRCKELFAYMVGTLQKGGSVYECGVYKGGTALLLAELTKDRTLKLFDTFSGMPKVSMYDLHKEGDFADTSLEAVKKLLKPYSHVEFHPGFIPDTFPEDDDIVFAHVDVDIFQSVWDCCSHIVPRLRPGGIIIFDDYGFPSCPGAKKAVDEFFSEDRMEIMNLRGSLIMPGTGQAIFVKSGVVLDALL